jgi:hypothetical protein
MESVHKNLSLHLSREPPVSRLRCTALAAAFSFSNKSMWVHYPYLMSLFLRPAKTRNPHHWHITFCGDPDGTLPQDQRSVLKVSNWQESAWGATVIICYPYGFSHWGHSLLQTSQRQNSLCALPSLSPPLFIVKERDLPCPVVVFSQAKLTKAHQQTLMDPSLECNASSLLAYCYVRS